jgi:hypothetical protein
VLKKLYREPARLSKQIGEIDDPTSLVIALGTAASLQLIYWPTIIPDQGERIWTAKAQFSPPRRGQLVLPAIIELGRSRPLVAGEAARYLTSLPNEVR